MKKRDYMYILRPILFILSLDVMFIDVIAAGEGSLEEDGSAAAAEHLPESGDRPDAASHHAGPPHPQGPQARHRRDHRHVRDPA